MARGEDVVRKPCIRAQARRTHATRTMTAGVAAEDDRSGTVPVSRSSGNFASSMPTCACACAHLRECQHNRAFWRASCRPQRAFALICCMARSGCACSASSFTGMLSSLHSL